MDYFLKFRNHIDFIIDKYGTKNKFFVEAGANDGVIQSNTYHLEKFSDWTGICIEPNYENYLRCLSNRSNSICFNLALVSEEYEKKTITGLFNSKSLSIANGLMSGCTEEHLNEYPDLVCEVSCSTLTECLENANAPFDFDFLSLDVENYELEVLKGLDFTKFRPRIIFLEIGKWHIDEILQEHFDFLNSKGYEFDSTPNGWTKQNPIPDSNFCFVDKNII